MSGAGRCAPVRLTARSPFADKFGLTILILLPSIGSFALPLQLVQPIYIGPANLPEAPLARPVHKKNPRGKWEDCMPNSSLRLSDVTRRAALLGAGATALAAPSGSVMAQTSGFDWKRFKGEHIEVSLVRNPRHEILQRFQREFENLTGIDVGFELVGDQQHRQKQIIDFSSGTPGFDVTSISYHAQKRLFANSKWLADLGPLLNDPSLTAAEFDYSDFSPSAVAFASPSAGRVESIPLSLDYFMFYCNQAMLAEAGVNYPSDFSEVLSVASKMTNPSRGEYGWIARGLKNANTYIWAALMLGWGEEAVGSNGQLNTEGAAAVAAAEFYAKLGRECGPPGSVGFNWAECQSSFMQGKIGIWPDISGFAAPLEDPTKSRLKGKVNYGVVPRGPKAQAVAVTGDGLGIAAASRKKGPAHLYLQWATGQQNQARILQAGAGTGSRNSIYADQSVLGAVTAPNAWIDCVKRSSVIARPCLPDIVPINEFRDIFGIALTNMLSGGDARAELSKATEQFKPILERG
jgi:multiple sugar transport system substrate-binding protein